MLGLHKGYSFKNNNLKLDDLYFLNADGQISEYQDIFDHDENFS